MGVNKRKHGNQKSEQRHAEGQHGQKTINFLREQHIAQSGKNVNVLHDPVEIRKHNTKGKDRLFEDREQHDDADKASEKTRLARDIDRHNHNHPELTGAARQAYAKRKG